MDTLTHIVLGACIGEAIAGRQLGKKVLLLGALAQSIPDIDFVSSFWLPTAADVLAHRGFTHSFLFVILLSPILAWASGRLFSKSGLHFRNWLFFWAIQIFIHDFIDSFNVYGTGWLEPFSHYRVSFNSLFVADPLFSIWLAIATAVLIISKSGNKSRKKVALTAVICSSAYLALSIGFKVLIDRSVERNCRAQQLSCKRYFSTPTPLNNLLWYIVIEHDSGFYIGYRSVLDHKHDIVFHCITRNDALLQPFNDHTDVAQLKRFSQGYYSIENKHDTLVFNDLRFGEIAGWPEPGPDFVFHYYLQYPADNKMIVQRGRFANWDKSVLEAFLTRMRGN